MPRVATLLLALSVFVAAPALAAVPPANLVTTSPLPPSEDEIVVTAERRSERYRLPEQFRRTPERAQDRWRGVVAGDALPCRNVGAMGCGTKGNPIVTVGADGGIIWGTPAQ